MTSPSARSVLLALYPNMSGLGFAAFEGDLRAVDWGIKTARKRKHETTMRHAAALLNVFSPSHLILPARTLVADGSRRLHKISLDIARISHECGSRVHWYSREDIKSSFSRYGANSKDAIVAVIARHMPEFQQHVPPKRRIWMSEDYRMGLFDAVALAMTHYAQSRQ